ncbi:MAG: phosphodiester glycosidase family protein [Deltaproteobacteria bacterium]|nr:MAG: phosphodiester glycosidase family protein [Deltaproteobacteria bacterium]
MARVARYSHLCALGRKGGRLLFGLLSLLLVGVTSPPPRTDRGAWIHFEPGFSLGVFDAPRKPEKGDGKIRILRIDPARFALRIFCASDPTEGKLHSARAWAKRHGLLAATNTSMYQKDFRTSVSLLRSSTHVNNPRLTRDNAILAFDPIVPGIPLVRILDRACDDFQVWTKRYASLVQSIRMYSCTGKNVWQQQPEKKWSHSAIGTDKGGNVLFIHVRSPYTTHDLIEMLVSLPIDLDRLMYTEGGGEAQLFIQHGEETFEFLGIDEAPLPFLGSRDHPIPNVIGVIRRQRSPGSPALQEGTPSPSESGGGRESKP